MLPKNFKLERLDNGIKNLVITLNKIPEVHTATTCEGHVWRDCPAYPTKDGWVYFSKDKNGLTKTIENFCIDYPAFILDYNPIVDFYIINGTFGDELGDPHKNSAGIHFEKWSKDEQEKFFEKADIRKKEILLGWNELDSRLKDYIIKNITRDIESLSYFELNPNLF